MQNKAEWEKENMARETKMTKEPARSFSAGSRPGRKPDIVIEKMAKSAANTVGRQVARELVRGIMGSLLRK